jgi:hypothetical protein
MDSAGMWSKIEELKAVNDEMVEMMMALGEVHPPESEPSQPLEANPAQDCDTLAEDAIRRLEQISGNGPSHHTSGHNGSSGANRRSNSQPRTPVFVEELRVELCNGAVEAVTPGAADGAREPLGVRAAASVQKKLAQENRRQTKTKKLDKKEEKRVNRSRRRGRPPKRLLKRAEKRSKELEQELEQQKEQEDQKLRMDRVFRARPLPHPQEPDEDETEEIMSMLQSQALSGSGARSGHESGIAGGYEGWGGDDLATTVGSSSGTPYVAGLGDSKVPVFDLRQSKRGTVGGAHHGAHGGHGRLQRKFVKKYPQAYSKWQLRGMLDKQEEADEMEEQRRLAWRAEEEQEEQQQQRAQKMQEQEAKRAAEKKQSRNKAHDVWGGPEVNRQFMINAPDQSRTHLAVASVQGEDELLGGYPRTGDPAGSLRRPLYLPKSIRRSTRTNSTRAEESMKPATAKARHPSGLLPIPYFCQGKHRFMRFTPTRLRGGDTLPKWVHLSGFEFYGAQEGCLMQPRQVCTVTEGGSVGEPTSSNDLDFTARQQHLIFDFGVHNHITSYRWATAEGNPQYDATQWVLEGTNDMEGTPSWEEVDDRTGLDFPTPTSRIGFTAWFPPTKSSELRQRHIHKQRQLALINKWLANLGIHGDAAAKYAVKLHSAGFDSWSSLQLVLFDRTTMLNVGFKPSDITTMLRCHQEEQNREAHIGDGDPYPDAAGDGVDALVHDAPHRGESSASALPVTIIAGLHSSKRGVLASNIGQQSTASNASQHQAQFLQKHRSTVFEVTLDDTGETVRVKGKDVFTSIVSAKTSQKARQSQELSRSRQAETRHHLREFGKRQPTLLERHEMQMRLRQELIHGGPTQSAENRTAVATSRKGAGTRKKSAGGSSGGSKVTPAIATLEWVQQRTRSANTKEVRVPSSLPQTMPHAAFLSSSGASRSLLIAEREKSRSSLDVQQPAEFLPPSKKAAAVAAAALCSYRESDGAYVPVHQMEHEEEATAHEGYMEEGAESKERLGEEQEQHRGKGIESIHEDSVNEGRAAAMAEKQEDEQTERPVPLEQGLIQQATEEYEAAKAEARAMAGTFSPASKRLEEEVLGEVMGVSAW